MVEAPHILVTGASGGLAPGIIQQLLNAGVKVTVTARSSETIENSPFFSKVNFLPWDINNHGGNLFDYFQKPDSVIHLAWEKLSDLKHPDHELEILDRQKQFLTSLIIGGLKDITVVGTAYEYGMQHGLCSETDTVSPVVPYGNGKNKLRMYLEQLNEQYPFKLKWLRLFNVFSEGRKGKNLYSHLMLAIEKGEEKFNMSGGEQVRDYMLAEEASIKLAALALQSEVTGIINCCSGKPVKLKDMIIDFLSSNHLQIPLNLGFYPYVTHEPMEQWGNSQKMKSALAVAFKNYPKLLIKTYITSA